MSHGWTRITLGAAGLVLLATLGQPARASVISGWGTNTVCDCLLEVTVDPGAGAATTTRVGTALDPAVGPGDSTSAPPAGNRFATPVRIAARPSDGALFAVNTMSLAPGAVSPDYTMRRELVAVDPTTGHGTLVDALERVVPELGEVSFAPDDTLYSFTGQVWTIDTATGQPITETAVTDAVTGDPIAVYAGTFREDGTLLAYGYDTAGAIYAVDADTGLAQRLGGFDAPSMMQTMAWDPVNELLWGVDFTALFTIDLSPDAAGNLGISDTIAYSGDWLQGLAFRLPAAQRRVPEPAAALLLALGLAGLCATGRSRPPSSMSRRPGVASHRRTACSRMVSKTGW